MKGVKGEKMSYRNISLVFLLVGAYLLASCAASPAEQPGLNPTDEKSAPRPSETEGEADLPDPEATKIPDWLDDRPTQTMPPGLERVEITPPALVTGEVPVEIMEEIIADLMKSTGAERDAIQVIRSEAVVWNDGSLGCPKPGEFYIQVLINGYWVVLEVEGMEYDYRVSDKGSFRLCEG
jgi:hypothetical protein